MMGRTPLPAPSALLCARPGGFLLDRHKAFVSCCYHDRHRTTVVCHHDGHSIDLPVDHAIMMGAGSGSTILSPVLGPETHDRLFFMIDTGRSFLRLVSFQDACVLLIFFDFGLCG